MTRLRPVFVNERRAIQVLSAIRKVATFTNSKGKVRVSLGTVSAGVWRDAELAVASYWSRSVDDNASDPHVQLEEARGQLAVLNNLLDRAIGMIGSAAHEAGRAINPYAEHAAKFLKESIDQLKVMRPEKGEAPPIETPARSATKARIYETAEIVARHMGLTPDAFCREQLAVEIASWMLTADTDGTRDWHSSAPAEGLAEWWINEHPNLDARPMEVR